MNTRSEKLENTISHTLPYYGNQYSYDYFNSGKFNTDTSDTTGTTGTTTTTTTTTNANTGLWINAASNWLSTIGNTLGTIFRKTPQTVVYQEEGTDNTVAWILGGGIAIVLVVVIVILAKKK